MPSLPVFSCPINFTQVPEHIMAHIILRLKQRVYNLEGVVVCRKWCAEPQMAPRKDWYADFGTFWLVGHGKSLSSVLDYGMFKRGIEIPTPYSKKKGKFASGKDELIALRGKGKTGFESKFLKKTADLQNGCDWAHPAVGSVVLSSLEGDFPDFVQLVSDLAEAMEPPVEDDPDWDAPISVYLMPTATAMKHISGWGLGDDAGDNRGQPHVDEMKKSMQQGERMPPAIVDEKGHIADGRHRIHAASQLGVQQIPYIKLGDLGHVNQQLKRNRER
jgi:hypothetical protein